MPKDEDKKFQFEFHEESQKKLDKEANRLMQEKAAEIEKKYAEELNRNILAQQRSAGRIEDEAKDMAIDADEEFTKKRQIRRMKREQTSDYTQAPDKIYAQEEPKEIPEEPAESFEQYIEPEQLPMKDDESLIDSKKAVVSPTKEEEEKARRARGERPTDFQTEPVSRAGISRADTRDIGKQKPLVKRGEESKPQAKQAPSQAPKRDAGQQRRSDIQRRKMLKEQAKRRKAEEQKEKQAETKKGGRKGKMGVASFVLWLSIAVVTDILSIIPYVGLVVSWPFALFFGAYKLMTGIKKEVAVATTALDFLAEGLFSTLPGNTLDVIITFVVSNSRKK